MDAELESALTPVLRDLTGSGDVRPDVRDEPWSDQPGTASAYLYAPDGTGAGVWVELGQPLPTRIVALAGQVQEWYVEECWSAGLPTNHPACPEHPDTHPLAPVQRADHAYWACPQTGTEFAEIGSMPTLPGS